MHQITRRALGAMTLASLLALTACASLTGGAPANVADLTASNPELSTFTKLVQQAGLQDALTGAGPITVFAPNNDAFKALPAATLEKLGKDPEALKSVLAFHLVNGAVRAKDVATDGSTALTTRNGAKVNASRAGTFVTVDESLVVAADQSAPNGVVHVIDRVLTPPKK